MLTETVRKDVKCMILCCKTSLYWAYRENNIIDVLHNCDLMLKNLKKQDGIWEFMENR